MISCSDCPPIVLNKMIDHWKARKWSIEQLSRQITKKLSCKLCPKKNQNLFETQCPHETITLEEFLSWRQSDVDKNNPLSNYKPEEFSCYIDYKYMKDMSPMEHMKAVDWGVFGFPDRDGRDSTIWIGTEGCYTNCHYDSYGFNLVAQIQGKKRWILYPPWESSYLYPTRIPYEESSVFSEVNVKNPDFERHPLFKKANPYIVTLDPGQVLYVPPQWWHYVESLEDSISINTWIEISEDSESRVSEAVTRCLFSLLLEARQQLNQVPTADDTWINPEARQQLNQVPTADDTWINPGEEILPLDANIQLLQFALTSSYHRGADKETNNRDKLCKALQNTPVRNKDTTLKGKRKFIGKTETENCKSARMCVHDKEDNSDTVNFKEKLCTHDVDVQSSQDGDIPYIVMVERENKDEEKETSMKHQTTDLCRSSLKTCSSHSTATLFEKLVKSVLHPNVIEATVKELNQ